MTGWTPAEWQPRPDQAKALAWLGDRDRAALFLRTGQGKTAIASRWLVDLLHDRCVARRILIVAPKQVAPGWPAEWAKWAQFTPLLADRRQITFDDLGLTKTAGGALGLVDKRATKARLLALREMVHVASWDALTWVVQALGKAFPYDTVVLDESSMAKDRMGGRGKACRVIAQRLPQVRHLLLLSASPADNDETDVFSQIDLVAPGLLGTSMTNFRGRFCEPATRNWQTGEAYSWRIRPPARAEFEALCRTVSCSVADAPGTGLDGPRLRFQDVVATPVAIPPSARAFYADLKRHQVARLDGRTVTAGSTAVLSGKLRQVCSGSVIADDQEPLFVHDAKTQALQAILAAHDEPTVVCYEYTFELAWLRALLGDRVADIRQRGAKGRFITGELPVLALHGRSGGHGIDGLQQICRRLVFLTAPVDAEVYKQVIGRLARPGQQREVLVQVLYAEGTIEEDRVLREILPQKEAVASRFERAVAI